MRMEIVDANLFEKGSGPTRSYASWEDIRLSQQYIKIIVASEKQLFRFNYRHNICFKK